MPTVSPLPAVFLGLDGSVGYVSFTDKPWYKGAARCELILDFSLEALPAATRTVFGKDTVGPRFEIGSTGLVSFVSIRSGGTKTVTATTALTLGARTVIRGVDDGTNVTLWINGTSVATTTSASGNLTVNTSDFYVGRDVADAVVLQIKVSEFQLNLNDEVVGRWVVRPGSGSTIRDLTDYGNDATITGAINTNVYRAPTWAREPATPGGELLR